MGMVKGPDDGFATSDAKENYTKMDLRKGLFALVKEKKGGVTCNPQFLWS